MQARQANKARLTRLVFAAVLLWPVVAGAERLPIRYYTVADGLAHNDINRIVRDSRGFLWFCTADGLSRFDGYTFTNFGTDQGLPHANVTDLLETRNGEYWVATYGGVVRFNPKGTPANHSAANETAPMFTIVVPEDPDRHAKAISVLFEDRNGAIWCGTLKGLYQLDQANGHLGLRPIDVGMPNDYPEQHFVSDVVDDTSGSLWVATASGLYRRWPDGSAVRYTRRDGLPDEDISDLLEDHRGQLWVGTRRNGFFQVAVDASQAPLVIKQAFSVKDGLPTKWVFQLFEDSARQLWIATAGGLVQFFPDGDERGQRFHSYSERNGLSYHDVTVLNEDLGGNLWLGTNTAGAMKLAQAGFVTYDQRDGLWWVGAIFPDRAAGVCFRGEVLGDERTSVFEGARVDLLGPDRGVRHMRFGRFDGQHFDWFKPAAIGDLGWVFEQVTLQSSDDEWWAGTNRGLYRFAATADFRGIKQAQPLAIYTSKDGLATDQVFRLFEDSRRNIWISTISAEKNGLAVWEQSTGRIRDLKNSAGLPSLKDELPRSFGKDRAGNVWIGFNNGLARYRDGGFRLFTAGDQLPSGAIMNIFLDHSGRLWLASARNGLVRVDDTQAEQPVFVNYTTAQGLSTNNTEVITEDAQGHIYVGGSHGLDRLDPDTGRVKHFTTADGLAPGALRAAFRDRTETLWFGTSSGLSRLLPAADRSEGTPPMLIMGLQVAGSRRLVSALGERAITLPDFAANQNQLQVDFVALGFAPGEVLRYQYKLEGTGADWSVPSEQRTVNYAQLAAGRYRFLVRAVNSEGAAGAAPAVISFTILRPVWQRWWFLTLMAAVLSLTAYAFYRYRMARLLEIANMRTRIATDLHDDIGANLTRITILSEVAKQRFGNGSRPEANPLSAIADIARESVASMSDIVWAINPEHDSLLDLTRKMRQHADEVFTLQEIELQFNAPGPEQHLRVGVNVRRDLLLIFKEAVNNAARHSHCACVQIELRAEGPRLLLVVSDDGSGFAMESRKDGQGLISMRRRAHKLGGTLEIQTATGKGVTVTATIPLSSA